MLKFLPLGEDFLPSSEIVIGYSSDVEGNLSPRNLEIRKYLDAELLLTVRLTHRLASLNEPIDLHELQK